ncbi:MAG: hypothetical protein N2505_00015 [Endomicrobia bacterium]|nr:hypothetical protein [Endomicrobiia bacterium]
MITDHFFKEFLKKKGFDEKIVQYIKPYNVEKQIEKVKQLSEREIEYINEILLKIHNKQYIFPLFYSSICKIDIKTIANYINCFSNAEPQKNIYIYHYNRIQMEHAMNLLTSKFNIDSIILIIELIDEEICDMTSLRDKEDRFKIDKINEKTFQVIKKIASSKMYALVSSLLVKKLEECMDKPYFDLLIDARVNITMIQDIEKLYSLNSLTNEKICILNTSIEKIISTWHTTYIIKHILARFETIQQIGWKRFVSIDFTKFYESELEVIMEHLTVENFHHLLNYDGDFNKLLFYLMMNDDNLANQAIKYLPSLIENIKPEDNVLSIYQLRDEILNFVKLYKRSKPFDFLLKPYCFLTKKILTELILREYPDELVTNEEFIKRIDNLNCEIWENDNCLIISKIEESIYNNLNIFLYENTYEEIATTKNILEKKYKLHNQDIKIIKELIKKYLILEKDEKVKKELLTYLTTAKTKKRKIILYPTVIDFMNSINKKSKSLFYLACKNKTGFSLIETKMINEFKQFLSL